MAVISSPDSGSVRRVAAVGTWDGVHLGHRYLIDRVRALAADSGRTPAVVTFPSHPLMHIAPDRTPLMLCADNERIDLLQAQGVDVILLPFDEHLRQLSASDFMSMLRDDYGVDILIVGFNNLFGCDRTASQADYVKLGHRLGMEVIIAGEYSEGVSSTAIRRMISDGRVADASSVLGRCYSLEGRVVHGHQLGRKIGFPTANLLIDNERRRAIPAEGVYAGRAITSDGDEYDAVVNIGHRPTVESDGARSIEVYLMEFQGDIYGHRLKVQFVDRMRGEKRFDSLEQLTEQIKRDVDAARTLLSHN